MQRDACAVCKKVVKGEVVRCEPCDILAHPSCLKLHRTRGCIAAAGPRKPTSSPPASRPDLGASASSSSETGPAPICIGQSSSSSAPPTVDPAFYALIQDLSQTMANFMSEQRAQFARVNARLESLTTISADHAARIQALDTRTTALEASANASTSQLAESTSSLQASLDRVSQQNARLTSELDTVRSQVSTRLELARRATELTISGLPESPGEDLRNLVQGVALALGVELGTSDILTAARMRGTPTVERPRMLHVKLASPATRDALLAAKRAKRTLPTSSVVPSFTSGTILVNEYLPRELSSLLGRCRALARERGFSRVWHRDGSIFVKTTASARPVRIDSESEIAAKLP